MTLLAVSLLNGLTHILHVGAITACESFHGMFSSQSTECLQLPSSCLYYHRNPNLLWTPTSQCHLYPKMSLCWGSSQLYSQ
ncbi:hypothetical protein EV401DRAFT_2039273 [Pisolithus croceorrhizus]|nr:hypothetical protein EV401DRAFT_2039273 [Pisolithus croceorrhizus]